MRARLDPRGRFANEWTDRVLGPVAEGSALGSVVEGSAGG